MIVNAADFDMTDNGPDAPAHFADWGWGPDVYCRHQAMWTLAATRRFAEAGSPITGCPLGTGKTVEAAQADLIARTNAESKTALRKGD